LGAYDFSSPHGEFQMPVERNEQGHVRVHRGVVVPRHELDNPDHFLHDYGVHWSTNEQISQALADPAVYGENDDDAGLLLSGWYDPAHGTHSDPDPITGGQFYNEHEQEITMPPGTPIHVDRARWKHPDWNYDRWEDLGWSPRPHTAARLGMATMDDYARQPRDDRGRILLHRGVGEGANQVTFHNTPDPTGRTQNDFHFAPPAHWDEAMDNLHSEQGDESYGGYWGTQDEARFYAGDANGAEPHGAMTVSSWWHPDDVHSTENWQDGLWVHPEAQGEVAQAHVYHRGQGWVPLPGAEGRSVTAARLAMPAPLPEGITFHYHETDETAPPTIYAPAIEARHDGKTVGKLEWFGEHEANPNLPHGEINMVEVHPDYRRHNIATTMFDHARRIDPAVKHSPGKTNLGQSWAEYEQSRTAARLASGDSYPSGSEVDANAVMGGVRRLADFAHRTHPGAAVFLDMTPDEQFDHFNTHLAALYEQHGLPVPGRGRWMDFTDAVKEHWRDPRTAARLAMPRHLATQIHRGMGLPQSFLQDKSGEEIINYLHQAGGLGRSWATEHRNARGIAVNKRGGLPDDPHVPVVLSAEWDGAEPDHRGPWGGGEELALKSGTPLRVTGLQVQHEPAGAWKEMLFRPVPGIVTAARLAALDSDLAARLHTEFHDWAGQQDDPYGNYAPNSWNGRGPIGNWINVEEFLKSRYPAAHKDFDMGWEQARHMLDRPQMMEDDYFTRYETGPEAVAKHGYDPAEVAAGMLLLHNQTHPHRWEDHQDDLDRLTDIVNKRNQMQKQHDNPTPGLLDGYDTAKIPWQAQDMLHKNQHILDPDTLHKYLQKNHPESIRTVTAARLAMPTWYHLTDNPDFRLDPDREPANYNGNHPFGKGVFLTQRPDEWAYTEDDGGWSGERPYVAEIDAPENLHEKLNVWHDPHAARPGDQFPGSEETFVPNYQFHHLTVQQVRPRKAKHMTAAITVYTKPDCPQCTMTKKQLDRLGIEHQTVDVTTDPDAHAYVTGLGYQSAPVVVVGDGERHWSGFRPDHLKGLVE
jgi:glutaredoxin-like protein NrdH